MKIIKNQFNQRPIPSVLIRKNPPDLRSLVCEEQGEHGLNGSDGSVFRYN